MKKYLLFIFIMIVFVLFSCEDSTKFDDNFSIYLLENDTLTTNIAEEENFLKLKLKNDPIFQYDDIISYEIQNHKVILKHRLSYYLDADSTKVFSSVLGYPFVLIANDEKIYMGSFTTAYSSYAAPNIPIIEDFSINNEENSFIISGAPIIDDTTYIDIRNDMRIINALGNKIIEWTI